MSTLAQLGVAINSGPAKSGSDEVKKSLKSMSTEARAMAQSFTAANKAVTDSMESQVRAQLKAEQAARRAAAEKQQQERSERRLADAVRQVAEEQERAATRVAAAEEKKVRAMAAAEDAAYRMDEALRKSNAAFGLGETGANRLRSSLAAVTTQIANTSSSATVLTSTLGSLALGNAATVGILAGVAAIGLAYDKFTEKTRQLKEAQEKATKSVLDFAKAQRQGVAGQLGDDVASAEKQLAAQRKQLDVLKQQIAGANVAAPFTAPGVSLIQAGPSTKDVQAQYDALQNAVRAGEAELNRIYAKANEEYSKLTDERLISLVRANKATVGEQTALRDRLKNLQDDLAKLTAEGGDIGKRVVLSDRVNAIAAVYEAQAKGAAKGIAAQTAWGAYVTKIFADVQRVVDESEAKQREATEKRNKAIADGVEKVDDYVAALKRENDLVREKVASLKGETNALDDLTEAQLESKLLAEARAKLPKDVDLDPTTADAIRALARERFNLNKEEREAEKIRKALASWDGSDPFTLPDRATGDAREFANGLRDAANAAGDLLNALGGSGSQLGRLVDQSGRLISALERAKAAKPTDPDQASSFGSFVGAAAPFVTVAATFLSVASVMRNAQREDAERRNALQRDFADSIDKFAKSVADGGLSTVQRERNDLGTALSEQVAKALTATGAKLTSASPGLFSATPEGLRALQSTARFTAGNTPNGQTAGALLAFADALDEIIKNADAATAALDKQQQARLTAATEDARVALLVAKGRTAEADAMRSQLDVQRKIDEATASFAGLDGLAEYIDLLRQANEAARQAAESERARQESYMLADVATREQRLAGNGAAANEASARGTRDKALDEANALFAAGKITAETLARLAALIDGEFNQALADFAQEADRAKRAQIEDLAIRQLVATGNDRAAEQARIDIANRDELQNVTDENLRALILYTQGLEAEKRAREDLAATQAVWADINERTIAALKVVNPQAAAVLEKQQEQAKRDLELANAKDDVIRQALRELYALQDQAEAANAAADAAKAVTDALQAQADAMQRLAGLATDITDEYLRATGQTFEADRQALGRKRDQRLGEIASNVAAAAGPAPTLNPNNPGSFLAFAQWQARFAALQADAQGLIDKVNATYNANLDKLVASQMQGTGTAGNATSGSAADTRASREVAPTVLGGDSVTFRGGNSITETAGVRLIDFAASQLAVQREILAELRGGRRGESDLLPSLARALDVGYGRRAADQRRTVYGEIA